MCGIAGIWQLTGQPVEQNRLRTFTDSLADRGPDGAGYQLLDDGALGLGHRRLSIIDTSSAGHQPMSYADGRYWITFNGEIYNYVELRSQLVSAGYRFLTNSDTEVLLAAFQ